MPSCKAAASLMSRKIAVLVLHRDARRQHLEHIPQQAQLGLRRAPFVGVGRCGLRVMDAWLGMAREYWRVPLSFS